MTEEQEEEVIVPSTVLLPELPTSPSHSPTPSTKRRASSTSSSTPKRPKLEYTLAENPRKTPERTLPPSRRGTVDADERKRGRRLFGGLLGALSQNTVSSNQKRRSGIDRKQAERVRAQAEEEGEGKRVRLERLNVARREEGKVWERQARRTRFESEAMFARFLKTTTEPVLYYRPWELRGEEEELIRRQIEEVENGTRVELDSGMREQQDQVPDDVDMKDEQDQTARDTILQLNGDDINLQENGKTPLNITNEQSKEDTKDGGTAQNEQNILAIQEQSSTEALKDHMDETGEDVVHGDEDAVLY